MLEESQVLAYCWKTVILSARKRGVAFQGALRLKEENETDEACGRGRRRRSFERGEKHTGMLL